MRAVLPLIAFAFLSLPAQAGSASGKVTAVHVDEAHVILVLDARSPLRAACNTGKGFAADAKSALGMAASQTVNSIKNSGLLVTAIGAGTCTVVPGFEDLLLLKVAANSQDNHK